MRCLHPKAECYIVLSDCLHKPQQCHHFGEALYAKNRQKPGCMRCLHPKAKCHIVHSDCLQKPQQCHHFGEALYAKNRQKPGCMRCLHPKAECYIVHHRCIQKPQQCHHFGEALFGYHLQIPWKDIRISIGSVLVQDSISGFFQVDWFGPVTQRWCWLHDLPCPRLWDKIFVDLWDKRSRDSKGRHQASKQISSANQLPC